MLKNNYSAWNISHKTFDKNTTNKDKLIQFARYGILSPSGHNSQPWLLSFSDENTLDIKINPDHSLSSKGSGLLLIEPHVSLGCFIETLSYAAIGHGYALSISFPKTFKKDTIIASVSILKATKAKPRYLEAISQRTSNRNIYSKKSIDEKVLKDISESNFKTVETHTAHTDTDIQFLAKKTEVAINKILSGPSYRQELSEWVRVNNTKKYDGMPGKTHGIGMFPSLLSKLAVKHVPASAQAKKFVKLVINSGGLIIVSSDESSKLSSINAGRQYTKICIEATLNGYQTSAIGASVVYPKTNEEVKNHFAIKGRPAYILRVGKSDKQGVRSPRYPLESVLLS